MNLIEPFQYDFLRHAFLAGLLLSVIAPLIGNFLVIRGYALFADALAHVSLLGVALSFFFGVPSTLGAIVVSVIAALGMERLRSTGRVMNESAIALFLSGSLALAIVVMGLTKGVGANLISYLFGSISTVTTSDFLVLLFLAVLVVGFLFFFSRELFLIALDEDLAKISGVRVSFVNYAFIGLAALIAASSIQIVGVLLIGALMVIPVLSALQLHRGFWGTLSLSVFFSVTAFVCGFFASYMWNLPSGGAVVLFAVGLFFLSILFSGLFRRH
jgi:zinc transport system permease protein